MSDRSFRKKRRNGEKKEKKKRAVNAATSAALDTPRPFRSDFDPQHQHKSKRPSPSTGYTFVRKPPQPDSPSPQTKSATAQSIRLPCITYQVPFTNHTSSLPPSTGPALTPKHENLIVPCSQTEIFQIPGPPRRLLHGIIV